MDMNQFRNHLQTIQGKLGAPQNQLWEEDVKKRSSSLNDAIQSVYLNENMKLAPKGKGRKAAEKMYEEADAAEMVLAEYLSAYFGDTLTEDTSNEEIIEAIESLNFICAHLYEFLESDETVEPNDVVKEAIDSIFDNGELNEDASDEELMEEIDNLFHVAATINEYLASVE